MNYLFLFTIGPVKGFIENSRKSMDLYAGSRFLSELMAEAVGWTADKKNIQVLFPGISEENKEKPANIPNRLIAEVKSDSETEMRNIAEGLSRFIKDIFHKRCNGLLIEAGIDQRGLEMAARQWNDFLEVYWVFEKYDPMNYSESYEKVFTRIQEVKGIRPFSQTREPWGRKCMLFPEYNAIFVKKYEHNGKKVYPYNTNPSYICDISENPFLQYVVKPKEALSAIALVKRIYGKKETDFYSIRRMMLRSCIDSEKDLFSEAGIPMGNGELMDMMVNAVYDLENGQDLDREEYTQEVIQKSKVLHKKINDKNVKLSSYYAIIKFDGDSMGDAFRVLETPEEQQKLSEKISCFAHKAPKIISSYQGQPVFAGGEDFLGFLPLDGLFDCIAELHENFLEQIGLSFSAGISIGHLMQPLKEVMEYVDAAEAAAKRMPGKNAAAVNIMKRSGDIVKMPPYKLSGDDALIQWKHLGEMVQMLKKSQCSKSLFFNITNLMKHFLEENVKPEESMAAALLKDCVVRSAMEDKQINKEQLLEKLMHFYRHADNMGEFLNTLDGIVFISREVI
ncbi:MAG: type III-B CRISPR-associated protein Cas10/Cmr2 [Clostridiaceae bacterium]|nr:type III-B CRISPR-associated protein Cas10/Cmr2 [Clostridiaceae bacterium]